jgi:hypothetical protein
MQTSTIKRSPANLGREILSLAKKLERKPAATVIEPLPVLNEWELASPKPGCFSKSAIFGGHRKLFKRPVPCKDWQGCPACSVRHQVAILDQAFLEWRNDEDIWYVQAPYAALKPDRIRDRRYDFKRKHGGYVGYCYVHRADDLCIYFLAENLRSRNDAHEWLRLTKASAMYILQKALTVPGVSHRKFQWHEKLKGDADVGDGDGDGNEQADDSPHSTSFHIFTTVPGEDPNYYWQMFRSLQTTREQWGELPESAFDPLPMHIAPKHFTEIHTQFKKFAVTTRHGMGIYGLSDVCEGERHGECEWEHCECLCHNKVKKKK